MKHRLIYILLSFTLSLFIFFNFFGLSGDSVIHIEIVNSILEHRYFIINYASQDSTSTFTFLTYPQPLYGILGTLVSYTLNITPSNALRLVSLIFYILIPIITYYLAKTIYDESTAKLSMLYVTLMWVLIYDSSYAWTESLYIFLILSAIYLMFKERFILAGVFTGFAYLTKFNGLFLLIVFIAYLITFKRFKVYLAYLTGFVAVSASWWLWTWFKTGTPINLTNTYHFTGFNLNALTAILTRTIIETGLLFIVALIGLLYIKERKETLLLFSYVVIAVLFFSGWSDYSSRLLSPMYVFIVIIGLKVISNYIKTVNRSYALCIIGLVLLPQIVFTSSYLIHGSPNPFKVVHKDMLEEMKDSETIRWIKNNTNQSDVIYTNIPEPIMLYTKRVVIVGNEELNSTNANRLNIKYVIMLNANNSVSINKT